MYKLSKENFGHMLHMPSGHKTAVWFSHLVHEQYFWAVCGAVAFLAILTAIITLSMIYGDSEPVEPMFYEFPFRNF